MAQGCGYLGKPSGNNNLIYTFLEKSPEDYLIFIRIIIKPWWAIGITTAFTHQLGLLLIFADIESKTRVFMLKFYRVILLLIVLPCASFSQITLLTESFESTVFPPTGWQNTVDGSGNKWTILNEKSNAVSGTNSAQIEKSYYSTADACH